MKTSDGTTKASWHSPDDVSSNYSLKKSTQADICVVGAEIAGLTAAYLLAREGQSVVVLDEGPIGNGQTGRTSAHLASAIDDRFVEMERMHGKETIRLAYQSHAAAIDCIEQITKREKIHCEFQRIDGLLTSVPSDPSDFLGRELAAAQSARAEVEMRRKGGLGNHPCLRFRNQARFHPIKYLLGLTVRCSPKTGRGIKVDSSLRKKETDHGKAASEVFIGIESAGGNRGH